MRERLKFLILFQIVARYPCKLPASQGYIINYGILLIKTKTRQSPKADPVPGHVMGQGFGVLEKFSQGCGRTNPRQGPDKMGARQAGEEGKPP